MLTSSGQQGPVSTSAVLADKLLTELSQSSSDPLLHASVTGSSTASTWIKKEDVETGPKAVVDSNLDMNIGMTATQILASCKGLGKA